MSVWKKMSLMAAALAAVASAVPLMLLAAPEWTYSGFGVAALGIVAIAIGLAVGVPMWLVAGRCDTDQRRLLAFIEALRNVDQAAIPTFRGGPTVMPLANAMTMAVEGLRQRVRQLIGQRRELEVQVHIAEAQRQHAEAILNSITDAVVVTDAFNEVAMANEAAARVLGFDLRESLRKPVDRVVPDPTLVKLIKDTRAAGDPSLRRHVEHKLATRGSRESVFEVAFSSIAANGQANGSGHAANGDAGASEHREAAGVVTILRDITREREIAEMKSDFVSSVSHELRTPLSSIKAYMEMLVDGEAHDEQTRHEFYNIIQGETNRLSRLIENILNISRIESGVVKVQREHIALPSIVREVIEMMQPQARAKNIEIVEVPTPLYFQVFADKDMIYQATMNLVGNAIKYTPDGGRVTVSMNVDEHARTVNVSVTDTGVGIPADDLPRLFEKFFRVAEHKKMAKGTGLGLNLVKQIIETVHGGKVSVQSTVGKGSTFTFSLPLADNGM